MPEYTILGHPADMGVEASGRSLAEAFEQAAHGLMSIILDISSVEPLESRQIELTASDPEQLLVRWLSEILYLYDGGRFACREFTIYELSKNRLRANVQGEEFSEERHPTRTDVKAVTYHQLCVHEGDHGATVRVFLDI